MNNIIEIINSINATLDKTTPNINPTVIYNEGWMSRLLFHQSVKEKTILGNLDFSKIANWTSEALISSPFINAQTHREGYTHADIAFGDFDVDYAKRGEIIVRENAKLFGIIEAKMGSNLSQGTTNAKEYNQASRNLVCIANNTYDKTNCKTFFFVVAPESKIQQFKIKQQIGLQLIKQQIDNRFYYHNNEQEVVSKVNPIIKMVEHCNIQAICYENWIDQIKNMPAKNALLEFYEKTKKWNRVK